MTSNTNLSAGADIGRGSRMRIEDLPDGDTTLFNRAGVLLQMFTVMNVIYVNGDSATK
jgi:hypothetical protein